MLEKNIEARLRKKLAGLFLKFISPGCTGVPDRIHIHQGKVVFIELKQPNGVLSPRQVYMIEQLRKEKANVIVVASNEEADRYIEEDKRWSSSHTDTNKK